MCSKCKVYLPYNEFYKDKYSPDGVCYSCKKCKGGKSTHELVSERISFIKNRNENGKKCIKCGNIFPLSSFRKSKCSIDGTEGKCKTCAKKYDEKSREKNRAKIQECSRNRKFNPEYMKKKRQYEKNRRQNIKYRVSGNVSRGIRRSLKSDKNGRHWESLVGYTIIQLKDHLEKQFTEGMSWDNYGEWHIDHIRPICSFNIEDYECDDFKKCWSLSNLQPLWAIENQTKNGKFDCSN